ncbi:MAG TPA: LUD domain-containing protein [Chloroflexota bacterium]|nr:LUD domain-containing protein [Chloroflexota bacterium]
MIRPFPQRYREALADARLPKNLLAFQRAWRTTRDAAFDRLAGETRSATWTSARAQLIEAKNRVLADPVAARREFVEAARAQGTLVHTVATADQARETILGILRTAEVRLLAKGKSMVAEEIFLNHHLEAAGLSVVETDLGEWIIQLAHETPSHMVMPAIHKSRQQIATLFEAITHHPVPRDDVGAQVRLARDELRRVFLAADAGMIGANALIAETGTVMLVTNEGNGDLVSTLPRLLIVIAGWEKIVPTFADAVAQVRLLARSGTGQEISTYTSFITGPEPGHTVHLVLIDNGRTAMWSDPDAREALRCIRCAACADVCPPYQVVGGQVFGYVYSGAIGLVNTPFHHGLKANAGPQSLCVSCNACATVCPVGIPLPQLILDARARVVEAQGLPWYKRAAFEVWARPVLFDAAARLASLAQRPLLKGGRRPLLRLPLPAVLGWRTVPGLARQPARDLCLGQSFEPETCGPWATSKARGLTVAYFLQCVADRLAPEQVDAALRVLRACGVRVVVPAEQHCCGLPALDSGDREIARRLARQTIADLESTSADYVVTGAASCAVAIEHDFPRLLRDEPKWQQRAERLAARTLDLLTFVDRVADPPQVVAGAGGPVTFHSFCQSTNVLGIGAVGPRLLARAGVAVLELPEAEVCCGFGGGASIDHPEVSRGIVARKLDNVRSTGAAVLCSDNPGCILHLRGAADAAGLRLEVKHVAEVLAEALSSEGGAGGDGPPNLGLHVVRRGG